MFPLLSFINLALYFMCNNKSIIDEKDMDKEFKFINNLRKNIVK